LVLLLPTAAVTLRLSFPPAQYNHTWHIWLNSTRKVMRREVWWFRRPNDGTSPTNSLRRPSHLPSETTELLVEFCECAMYRCREQVANWGELVADAKAVALETR
jgi:hypothetical protein